MGIIEILMGVVFTLAVGVGVTLTTSGTTPAEFWVARGCFCLASAAALTAYVIWVSSGPRDPSWRVLLGALIGVLVVAGTTETLFWVNFREQRSAAERVAQEAGSIQSILEALKDAQDKLKGQEAAYAIVRAILQQQDQLDDAITPFEQFSGSPRDKDRLSSAKHTIETLKVLLRNVQVLAFRQGRLLVIRTAPNTFRITFSVPMRVPPTIICHPPAGVAVTELEKTNIGVTLVFSPISIPVETVPPCEFDADL